MKLIDLHVHTNFSDGMFSPEEAVKYAHQVGLSAIAITDHDTTDGVKPAQEAAKEYGIEIIPGIELSSYLSEFLVDEIHILGYFIEWENDKFQEKLSLLKAKRVERAKQIIKKLAYLGVKINEERLFQLADRSTIGRLHFAQIMVEDGYVFSIRDAFYNYLGEGRPAFVPKMYLTPQETIKIILDVKGIPVLAHPNIQEIDEKVIKELTSQGLKGIEIFCSKLDEETAGYFQNLAKQSNLLVTGGSDCHGKILTRDIVMGTVQVPYTVLEELKKAKQTLFP